MTLRSFYLSKFFVLLLLIACQSSYKEFDYSLAATPPMGWNSWNTFYSNINEKLILETADAMVESGMAAVGYNYIVIDDGWASYRDAQGNIQPDSIKFPSGIKYVADYVHKKGLKFGIYSSAGETTCGKLPGSWQYETLDANQYARWGVDYLKYDWCGHKKGSAEKIYKKMSKALQDTGRPIVFSICEWGDNDPWEWGRGVGHLWRTTYDIGNCWAKKGNLGVIDIIDAQNGLEKYSGPGAWNDPDMLRIGSKCLTYEESKSHFSFWALLNAPLMAGNDLRNMTDEVREILTNQEVIAINQDPLGRQGFKFRDDGDLEYWRKELADGSLALILLNRSSEPVVMKLKLADLNSDANSFSARDLWEHIDLGRIENNYTTTVASHGIKFLRLYPN